MSVLCHNSTRNDNIMRYKKKRKNQISRTPDHEVIFFDMTHIHSVICK